MEIGGTYEEMKKAFGRAYGMRKYDTLVQVLHVRCARARLLTPFAIRFQGMLPTTTEADHELAMFPFLNKLPNEVRMTRPAIKLFENGSTTSATGPRSTPSRMTTRRRNRRRKSKPLST